MSAPLSEAPVFAGSGVIVSAGRYRLDVAYGFTSGTPQTIDLSSSFPDIDGHAVGLRIVSGTLPGGVSLDPLGKRLIYDGTAGVTAVNVTIEAWPDAPSLSFSNASGVIPVMSGVFFPTGLVRGAIGVVGGADLRVSVRRTWNDGSVKHAVVVGTCDAAFQVRYNTIDLGGALMTSADILAAAPTSVVDLGVLGSYSLTPLLSTPFETWISTPKFVECHYRASVPSTNMAVEFQVRLWHSGALWVRANVENSVRQTTNWTMYLLTGSVTIGGALVATFSSTRMTQNTMHINEAWIGTQYDVIPVHDVRQLAAAKAVPNYGMSASVNESTLAGLPQTYSHNNNAMWSASMGNGGYQNQIGVIPHWDVCYLKSADARAYRSVAVHSKAIFVYPVLWREQGRMLTPLDYPTQNYHTDGTGSDDLSTMPIGDPNRLTWELNHHGSAGYVHYILTGDAVAADAMLAQCAMMFQITNIGDGNGVNRTTKQQLRGVAWAMRTIGQAAGILPDSAQELPAIQGWFTGYVNWLAAASIEDVNGADSKLGFPISIGTYHPTTALTQAPWMKFFLDASLGLAGDIECVPAANMTKFLALREWMYQTVVGMLGDGTEYCYTYGGRYEIVVSDEIVPNYALHTASHFYKNWSDVMIASNGVQTCGTTLFGEYHVTEAPTTMWGNLMPAISYAVDHEAPGAAEAWARLTNADNWPLMSGATGWSASPVWGVTPRAPLTKVSKAAHVTIAGGSGGTMSAFYRDLPQGWNELVIPGTKPPGGILGYSGAAFNSALGKLYYFGGGHNDYYGEDVWELDVEERATYVQHYTPFINANPPIEYAMTIVDEVNWPGAFIVNGLPWRPYSRHTYQSVHWVPSIGKMFAGGGSCYSGTGEYLWQPGSGWVNAPYDTWLYNPVTTDWEYKGSKLLDPAHLAITRGVYDSVNDRLYSIDAHRSSSGHPTVYSYNPHTNVYTVLNDQFAPIVVYASSPTMAVDTLRNRLVCCFLNGGASAFQIWAFSLSTNTWTQLPQSGAVPTNLNGEPGTAYSTKLDRMYLVRNTTSGLSTYDMATGVWTNTAMPTVSNLLGVNGQLNYCPIRETMFLGYSYLGNVRLFAYKE